MAKAGDGSEDSARGDRTLAQVVTDGHGKYYDAVANGNVFTLNLNATATGIAAGNIVGAVAGQTAQFALWNPAGTSKNVSLLKFGLGIISGTWPAGPVFHGIYTTAPTIASTTAIPAYNNLVNGPAPVARYVATAAQAGTSLSNATAVVTFAVADFAGTSTVQANVGAIKAIEYIDGAIVLPPGTGWAPLWSGTGTSVLNAYSITWEETPV